MKPSLTLSISKSLSGRSHICQRWRSRAAPRLAHFLSPSHTLSSSFPYLCYKLPSRIHKHTHTCVNICMHKYAYSQIMYIYMSIYLHVCLYVDMCEYLWIIYMCIHRSVYPVVRIWWCLIKFWTWMNRLVIFTGYLE